MELKMHPEISQWRSQKLLLKCFGSFDIVHKPLFEDLREKGQLQNLVARQLPNGEIELIAGYQRYLALRALGKKPEDMDIKILENVSDEQAILIAFSENKTRKDLTMIEEARAFKSLQKLKLTHVQIAEKTQNSETYVRERLHLLELPKDVQKLMQEGRVPLSYGVSMRKLKDLGPQWQTALAKKIASDQWDRIKSLEEADEFVEQTIAAEKKRKDLVVKFGACPKCGSTNISEDRWSKKPIKLHCEACNHDWNRQTKEPWEIYELRQDADKLGLKVDIKQDGRAEVTPQEITQIVEERTKAIANVEKPNPAFRSFHTLSEMLSPFIAQDNLQRLEVDGETITIKLIQEANLHFKAIRKTYQTGQKSRIQVTEGWRDDEKVQQRMPAVKEYESSLPHLVRYYEEHKAVDEVLKEELGKIPLFLQVLMIIEKLTKNGFFFLQVLMIIEKLTKNGF